MREILQRQIQVVRAADFSLDHTLDSGQAFRWRRSGDGVWSGIIGQQLVRVRQDGERIEVEADEPGAMAGYFQFHVCLRQIVDSFPRDEHLATATQACWGLRLLKQDPWECLASFIASSTKQIVQIKQIVENLSLRLGNELEVGGTGVPACGSLIDTGRDACATRLFTFPSVETIAGSTHALLWDCKLGFRAKYLLGSARMIAEGKLDLRKVGAMNCDEAREYLCQLPGVGEKIANCVLLFAFGKHEAFPIDVWVERCLREMYFANKRNVKPKRLREFARTYFGPHAGYAQQYLFHYIRTQRSRSS